MTCQFAPRDPSGKIENMPSGLARCRVLPLPDEQVSFVRQEEFTRWHHSPRAKGPFFYPLNGPHGVSLTRMGHPGDPSHDHHRSIWFAHEKVSGVDFWSGRSAAFIRQQQWLAYSSGDDEATIAVRLGWYDGHDPQELMTQELVAAFVQDAAGSQLELQATFLPTSETLELGQTNFGMLGVRVAESISVHFGGGMITGSDGKQGERDLFGQPNRWMDYSGPIADGDTQPAWEGITLFDHPSNPNHPTKWHVREDGWMGPSLCRDASLLITRSDPLVLRYLLRTHAGPADPMSSEEVFDNFAARPGFTVERSRLPHRAYVVARG